MTQPNPPGSRPPVAHARPASRKGPRSFVPPLAGLGTVVVIGAIFALAIALFQGSLTPTVPVTVISQRAGLVMNPEAKVKMRGVQVGKVSSIDLLPNGQAALHLAMDPSQMALIPSNVQVNIASSTVFGAKYVELVAPEEQTPPVKPSATHLTPRSELKGQTVTVEINTVFQELTSVLAKIEPEKLNQTLGALARAFSGRGSKLGQSLEDLDSFLAQIDPSLPALSHDFEVFPAVANAYGDAGPDLIRTVRNASKISQSIVDEQHDLDALLISAIGLADIGNDVVGTNRKPLANVLHLLVPTTNLLNKYNKGITCGIAGIVPIATALPFPEPGIWLSASLTWGAERYRYPTHLPKVAMTSPDGSICLDLPRIPFNKSEPFVVGDVGANPWEYGNQQLLLNFDGLKQLLYGPIAGPPRNSAQIGQPG